ncbi:MAG TPA: hypothetical protein VGR57_12415 [Ktedonobacterales bacterium]|nr:hypothetical protein [Ktedonobacterales bacterium]
MARLRFLLLPFACLVLAACALSSAPAGVQVTPAPTITARHRGPILVQYCADNTGIYPLEDFHRANQLVATSLVAAVGANTEGLTLYATRFASDTFDPANTLPPFLVPATPAYPALPTPLPTAPLANPVSYGATATALANQQSAAIAGYNAQMVSVKTQLASIQTQVAQDAQRLSAWNPPVDNGATSVWGCLQLARQRLAGPAAMKYLLIASDMRYTTGVDYTADFAASQALQGIHVHVIYQYCANAATCQSVAAHWGQVFTTSGAASVRFDDPAQSATLINLFAES